MRDIILIASGCIVLLGLCIHIIAWAIGHAEREYRYRYRVTQLDCPGYLETRMKWGMSTTSPPKV